MGVVKKDDFTCDICCKTVLSTKRFVNQIPCIHSSYCVDCIDKYIQAKVEEYKNIMETRCSMCNCLFCFRCRGPLHTGYRCALTDNNNDILFYNLARERKWQRCPCNRCVGCDLMHYRCRQAFCYVCGEWTQWRHNHEDNIIPWWKVFPFVALAACGMVSIVVHFVLE